MEKLEISEIKRHSLNVLKKIKEICEKENLKYFLTYGTLIGAIRHSGFIPWDDDVDIMMPREDYEKFVTYCINNKEALNPFELFHYKTCKKYIYGIARFSDSNYIIKSHIHKDCGMGIFVDIYPIDAEFRQRDIFKVFLLRMYRVILENKIMLYNKDFKLFKKIKIFLIKILSLPFSRRFILKKMDNLVKKNKYSNSQKVGCVLWDLDRYHPYILKETISHRFEDDYFAIPKEYDAMLKNTYGDYMTLPVESEQIPTHFYDVYRK